MHKISLVLINLIFGSLGLFSYYNGVTKNPELIKSFGKHGENLANQKFSVISSAKKLEKLFKSKHSSAILTL